MKYSILLFSLIFFMPSAMRANLVKHVDRDEHPHEEIINTGIENETTFILIQNGDYYLLKKPFLDIFYSDLRGAAQPIEKTQALKTNRLELNVKAGVKISLKGTRVFLDDISTVIFKKASLYVAKPDVSSKSITAETTKKELVKKEKTPTTKPAISDSLECDKLLLTSGKKIYVKILGEDKLVIRYKLCGDQSDKIYERQLNSISEMVYAEEKQAVIEPNNDEVSTQSKDIYDHQETTRGNTCGDILYLEDGEELYGEIIELVENSIYFVKCSDTLQRVLEFHNENVVDMKYNLTGFHDPSHISKNTSEHNDLLTLKSGTEVMVRVIEVTEDGVSYKKSGDALNRTFEKPLKFVSTISYADGYVEYCQSSEIKLFNAHLSESSTNCADKLILFSGLEIDVRIIYVTNADITYRKCSDKLNRTFVKQKKFVAKIMFEDGFVQNY